MPANWLTPPDKKTHGDRLANVAGYPAKKATRKPVAGVASNLGSARSTVYALRGNEKLAERGYRASQLLRLMPP